MQEKVPVHRRRSLSANGSLAMLATDSARKRVAAAQRGGGSGRTAEEEEEEAEEKAERSEWTGWTIGNLLTFCIIYMRDFYTVLYKEK